MLITDFRHSSIIIMLRFMLLLAFLTACSGFSLSTPPLSRTTLRSPSPVCQVGGAYLTQVNHDAVEEVVLSGGQRRTLRNAGKSLAAVSIADISSAANDVQALLEQELVKVAFEAVTKKPDAQLLANELAANTGAAVAECIGNECLLYRPSPQHRYL